MRTLIRPNLLEHGTIVEAGNPELASYLRIEERH